MRKGFTLVELSIVLVVIGLLIAGVLTAQSLMGAARLNSQVHELQEFDAGVINFKSKYRYLPGDAPQFGGNGDRVIDLYKFCDNNPNGCPYYINTNGWEISAFWSELFPEKYAQTPQAMYTSSPAVIDGDGKNVPASKIGESGAFFIASGLGGDSGDGCQAFRTDPKNYYAILGKWQLKAMNGTAYQFMHTSATTSAAKPEELAALDSKFDDGKGTTGNVISGKITGGCGPGATGGIVATPLPECSDSGTGAYNFSTKTTACTPLIRIGGDMKLK